MIKLKVEEYCHDCPDFEADVHKVRCDNLEMLSYVAHTTVTCEHAARCRAVKRYLEKQQKGE